MPTLALNTAGLSAADTERAVRLAAPLGITHVDFHPGIERDGVARALAALGGPSLTPPPLYLTTKIRKAASDADARGAAAAAEAQIADDLGVLSVRCVDLLLLRDHPSCDVMLAQWRVLERARAAGLARDIGLVNFCEGALRCVLGAAKVPPAVDYFMLHPGMGPDAHGLRMFGEAQGMRTLAYGPVGEPWPEAALLSSPDRCAIGDAHGRSVEQVALRWLVQSGCAVSVRPSLAYGPGTSACAADADGGQCGAGLLARSRVFDWSLSAAEMARIDALRAPDGDPTLFASAGCRRA
jgi:2,5-diketo-D-gluconate reductase A